MKKLLLLLLFAFNAGAFVAQDKKPVTVQDTTKIPGFIQQKFAKEYPAITPAWAIDGKNYKAFYTDPKTNMSQLIVYDHEGNVMRRESELDKMDLEHKPAGQPKMKAK